MTAVADPEVLKIQAQEANGLADVARHVVDAMESHGGLPRVEFNFRATLVKFSDEMDQSLAGTDSDIDPYTGTPVRRDINPEFALLVGRSTRVA